MADVRIGWTSGVFRNGLAWQKDVDDNMALLLHHHNTLNDGDNNARVGDLSGLPTLRVAITHQQPWWKQCNDRNLIPSAATITTTTSFLVVLGSII